MRLNDLLLPIVKGYGSEKGYELLATSLQVLGGSGFTQDYPVEQYIRDFNIDPPYEGATSIQGMDLFFRKIVRDQGTALGALLGEIQEFSKSDTDGSLTREWKLLARALDDVQAMNGHLVSELLASAEQVENVYKVGLGTTRLLMSCGDLVVAWLLLRQAVIALAALPTVSGRDRPFYEGGAARSRAWSTRMRPSRPDRCTS